MFRGTCMLFKGIYIITNTVKKKFTYELWKKNTHKFDIVQSSMWAQRNTKNFDETSTLYRPSHRWSIIVLIEQSKLFTLWSESKYWKGKHKECRWSIQTNFKYKTIMREKTKYMKSQKVPCGIINLCVNLM